MCTDPDPDHDQHYIDAVLAGDVQAFSILVDRYKHMVFTLAVRILKNSEEAEEVAQDVFVRIYRSIDTFQGNSKFSTWIYRIAYHKSLDYLRKKGRTLDTRPLDESHTYDIGIIEDNLNTLDVDLRKASVKSAISELSPSDATVITLHYFEELSLKQISEIMGIAPNTIKVRLFRSRKRLAAILQHKLGPEIIKNYGR